MIITYFFPPHQMIYFHSVKNISNRFLWHKVLY